MTRPETPSPRAAAMADADASKGWQAAATATVLQHRNNRGGALSAFLPAGGGNHATP